MAMVVSMLANCFRDSKKKRTPFKPADFMPQSGGGQKKRLKNLTQDELLERVRIINAAAGGREIMNDG